MRPALRRGDRRHRALPDRAADHEDRRLPGLGEREVPRDPEIIPPPHPSAFTNDVDRHIEHNIRGGGGGGPATLSKEPAPARIDESTIDQSAAKEEQQAAAAARVATAVPVTLVEEPKATKGKS
jgi:hypothetical protein